MRGSEKRPPQERPTEEAAPNPSSSQPDLREFLFFSTPPTFSNFTTKHRPLYNKMFMFEKAESKSLFLFQNPILTHSSSRCLPRLSPLRIILMSEFLVGSDPRVTPVCTCLRNTAQRAQPSEPLSPLSSPFPGLPEPRFLELRAKPLLIAGSIPHWSLYCVPTQMWAFCEPQTRRERSP